MRSAELSEMMQLPKMLSFYGSLSFVLISLWLIIPKFLFNMWYFSFNIFYELKHIIIDDVSGNDTSNNNLKNIYIILNRKFCILINLNDYTCGWLILSPSPFKLKNSWYVFFYAYCGKNTQENLPPTISKEIENFCLDGKL